MTLIFMDGCETGDGPTKYDEWSVGNLNYVTGRNGQGLQVTNAFGNLRKQFDAADEHATIIIGRAFKPTNTNPVDSSGWIGGGSTYGNLFTLTSDNGVTKHVSFELASGNTLRVVRGAPNGTLLGSYVFPSPKYTDWYYFEAKVVLHDTTGSVEVRVNGEVVINLTNIDTKNGGTKAVFDGFGIGPAQTQNNVHTIIDDLYVCNGAGSVNNNFLGDVAIETLYPNGNGSSSQFTGSDGNSTDNYLLVDEPGAVVLTDYVEDSVSGHKDLYTLSNLVRSSGPIYGIQVTSHLKNSDSGAVSGRVTIKSGATEADGADFPVVTTWKTARKIWDLNPDTAAAWSIAAVNALEAGVEVV